MKPRDRFGSTVPPPVTQWGWRTLTCTRCDKETGLFEIPATYLDDPFFGDFLCGECAVATRPA